MQIETPVVRLRGRMNFSTNPSSPLDLSGLTGINGPALSNWR
jgi:hypothetical protein